MVNRFTSLVCVILIECLGMSAGAVSDKESRGSFLARKVRHETIDGVQWNYFSPKDGQCGFLGYKDANVQISAVDLKTQGRVVMPSRIRGLLISEIGQGSFRGCSNIEEIVVAPGVRRIGPAAFLGCERLMRVILPDGLERIDAFAFYRCPRLKSINLPASVTNIGACAVSPNVLNLEAGNSIFFTKDGALYDKRSWTLVSYDGTNSVFEVDARVRRIGPAAFVDKQIRELRLPDGLEIICENAIYGCARLEHLAIPSTVTNIESSAFARCRRLDAIYFNGRKPQMSKDVYNGISCVFTFVRQGCGWEDPNGLLPHSWPRVDVVGGDSPLTMKFGARHCYAIRYWDGKRFLTRDQLYPLQIKFYEDEAVRGNAIAQKRLAWRYEHGIDGVKKDIAKAVDYLQGAALSTGDYSEMYKIGDFYRKGIKGKPNFDEARKWYVRALEGGGRDSFRACQELANLYRRGLGVEKDEETAFLLNLLAASHGMSGSQCVLSDCYEKGLGVATNAMEAARWDWEAEKSCWSGHELGLWYKYGGGVVDPDPAKAFRWFMYGVGQGNGVSACEIGTCYKTGYGVKRKPEKVLEYYMMGAKKGWSCGMNGVGECFEHGIGVATNVAEAARWYLRAAEADTDYWDGGGTLIRAGDCYAKGFGVEKDYAKAKEWYARAVERRHNETARLRILDLENKMRNEKKGRMTPEEKKADLEAHLAWCKKVEAAMPGDFLKVLDGFYAGRKNERDYQMTQSLRFGFEVAACICAFCDKRTCARTSDSLKELMMDAENYSSKWHGRLHSAITDAKSQDGKSLLVISTRETLEAVKEWVAEQGGQIK